MLRTTKRRGIKACFAPMHVSVTCTHSVNDACAYLSPMNEMGSPLKNETPGEERSAPGRRLGWKRIAVTVVAMVVVLPLAGAVFGVVFVPIVAVPAVFGFALLVAWYAAARGRHTPGARTRVRTRIF